MSFKGDFGFFMIPVVVGAAGVMASPPKTRCHGGACQNLDLGLEGLNTDEGVLEFLERRESEREP
jgi:hypothetical protein